MRKKVDEIVDWPEYGANNDPRQHGSAIDGMSELGELRILPKPCSGENAQKQKGKSLSCGGFDALIGS
jgi:hypothetical protein